MIKLKAGKLGDKKNHEVECKGYKFKWHYGDDWKTTHGCSTVTMFDSEAGTMFFELNIYDNLSYCIARDILKTFGIELVEKYRDRVSFLTDYYYINSNFEIKSKKEKHTDIDEDRFEKGNYFIHFDDAYNSELFGMLKRYSEKMKEMM